MAAQGWDTLLTTFQGTARAIRFRIMAYSEMMPSPWIGWRPYGKDHPIPRTRKILLPGW